MRYGIGFDFLLDNLEYSNAIWLTRTLYALRIAPEIGIGIGNKHSLMFGGFIVQNMGANRFPTKANITAYYAYNGANFGAYVGIFPRTKFIGTYPLSFFRQDFLFFSPNSNGLALQYRTDTYRGMRVSGEFVLDYFGGNLAKRYDEFFMLAEGKFEALDSLYLRANTLVYHFKNSEVLGDAYLMDRILYNLTFGVDFKCFVSYLNTAEISISALGQLERKRYESGLGNLYAGTGYEFSAKIAYKGFGIEESYYVGKPQMRYFAEYGEDFYSGLPFYQTDAFNRLKAYYEYKNDFLRVNIGVIFYAFDSTFALQQMLTLTLDTHKILSHKRIERF